MIREPAVAGTFYPRDAAALRGRLTDLLKPSAAKTARAVLAPHAGYDYTGPVAGAVYASLAIPPDVVLLAFNHRGRGAEFSIWPRGAWRTPIGESTISETLARRIMDAFPLVDEPSGFLGEHSAEVHVPFLQMRNPAVRIVPINLSCDLDEAERLAEFGAALAGVKEDFLVAASTDLNHYEADAPTRKKDAHALEAIKALDGPGLVDAIRRHGITMCGFAPTLAMIAYARAKGATAARLVSYATSADACGDAERVVGYAGFVVD